MTGTHRVAARPTAALVTALLGAVALALTGPAARADGDAAAEGVYVTVANPITSEVTNRVKERVDRAVREHKVQKVIFDFNPDNREANSPNFGPCSDLADYILDHPQLVTVAFVHGKVCRHTVLPVLACKEIVMSKDAALDDVLREPAEPLANSERQAYVDVAVGRSLYPAIVLKMLDKDMLVVDIGNKDVVARVMADEKVGQTDNGVFKTPAGWLAKYLDKKGPDAFFDGSNKAEYRRVKK